MLALSAAASGFLGPRLKVRPATPEERTAGRSECLINDVATVCAASLLAPDAPPAARGVMASDITQRFSTRNRAENALIVAEAADGSIAGAVGIEVQMLTKACLEDGAQLDYRPLLSNLAVDPAFRRRGLGKQLCRAAEREARGWGYKEVVLKVEDTNKGARKLYHGLGYRQTGIDREAEKPVVGSSNAFGGGGALRFVQTTNIALRKDLLLPPADVAAAAAALAAALAAAASRAAEAPDAARDAVFAAAARLLDSGDPVAAASALADAVAAVLS